MALLTPQTLADVGGLARAALPAGKAFVMVIVDAGDDHVAVQLVGNVDAQQQCLLLLDGIDALSNPSTQDLLMPSRGN